jgi:hypothetical protein
MIKDSVAVGYVHENEVSQSFHQCMMNLIGYDATHEGHITSDGGWLSVRCFGGDALPQARNQLVTQFLETEAEWLMWIDTDMGFSPDTFYSLLAVAHPVERPIVGALCFAYKQGDPDGMGGYRNHIAPTVFDWATIDGMTGFVSRIGYPVNKVIRVAGTGGACVLVHRSVYEAIASAHGTVWYDRVENPTHGNKLMSEDLSFCLRAGALNVPIYVHTGVKTTHHKQLWIGEQDYWQQITPCPATEATAVIVPVMRRPQNAKPFMESLRASTGMATVYAVCDNEDTETIKAWQENGARKLLLPRSNDIKSPGTFAEKINYGFRLTKEPWVFAVGDDVRFRAGWLDHAQFVAGDKFDVIGTNDLGNARVMAGEHSTHLLIRRSYVDTVGAGWDGPGIVAHAGYLHNFVDDEIVTAAKQHNVWAMAMGSRVEHMHPFWSKSDFDDVYRLGASSVDADKKLFTERLHAYAFSQWKASQG